jgi:hypothetical protein
VDYRLSPHTKEQGEKVFRERLIDATAQGQMGMAERAAIHEERNRQLSEALVEAAGVARSGLLIPNGPLVEEMEPEEREFYNRLVQRDPATGKPLSLRELGKLMGISHTTVKRRWAALARKYPKLSRLITEARAPHAKGENPDAIPSDRQGQEDEAEE